MDIEFLQHRLQQLEGRREIAFQPPNLPELVDELLYFKRRGLDLTSGIILLDDRNGLYLHHGKPRVAESLAAMPDDATPLKPFFYVRDEVLVAAWAADDVDRVLQGRKRRWDRRREGEELWVYKVSVDFSDEPARDAESVASDEGYQRPEIDAFDEVAAILASIRGRRRDEPDGRVEPPASVNVLFAASGMDCGSPAGDPEEPGDRKPRRGTPGAGESVTVAVLDSGILPDYQSYEALQNDVIFGPADIDQTYNRGYIHFPGCHGTFVAGVVRRVAPACKILAIKVLDNLN